MQIKPQSCRYYVQWATVCFQVRDSETQRAVGFHKSEREAVAYARRLETVKDPSDDR